MTSRPALELGFLVFLNYEQPTDALASLEDGLGLFERAEQLGFDSGWVRVHHGAKTLSAPFPFLTAAALRTSRIRLGTAVIPAGYEDPLRFAEDAATTDLLSAGRLELALSAGIPTEVGAGSTPEFIEDRLRAIHSAVRGDRLGSQSEGQFAAAPSSPLSGNGVTPLPHGPVAHHPELHAYPRSPGLENRLWYGAGSVSSALRAARLGLNLVLSTINTEAGAPTLGQTQAELIRRYREAFAQHHPDAVSKVAVARSILPLVDGSDRAEYGELAAYYDDLVTPEGKYRNLPEFTGQASPLYSGEPEAVVSALLDDPSLALADTLLLTPLSELDVAQKGRLFESVAEHIAPHLGWRREAALVA